MEELSSWITAISSYQQHTLMSQIIRYKYYAVPFPFLYSLRCGCYLVSLASPQLLEWYPHHKRATVSLVSIWVWKPNSSNYLSQDSN